MSQMMTRKGGVTDEKDKRQTDSPVKEMKKKMAANAEKEKQAAEKNSEKAEKPTEKSKQAEKSAEKPKQAEKSAEKPKQADKSTEKPKQPEKAPEKAKHNDKPADKSTEKKVEKNGVDNKKTESKDSKKETQDKKEDKVEKNGKAPTKNGDRPKQNGKHNGEANGVDDDDEVIEIADEEFPELAYDSGSDTEDSAPGRSTTRRSQVKATRTPETPQPAAEKPADGGADDSKDSKLLKLKDDATTERKLRSADSPKPDAKKETPKQEDREKNEEKENGQKDKVVVDVVVDVEEESRKPDTNYSKSRVKVSPYRRSLRIADQTTSSVMAEYTGNNTTMEMDITEDSISTEQLDDSYLSGLRTIRGRRSYKRLPDVPARPTPRRTNAAAAATEQTRPTGTVVGRKRKPEADDSIELATEAGEAEVVHGKRMRLLDRIALPFRRSIVSTPLPRRNPDIVGINTDLPLTAPVSSTATLDPETLKTPPTLAVTPPTPEVDKDSKRCVIM